ncbi:ORF37 [Lymantria xylina nucleopolyhedrovirus]|uniref:ORF37 n=1 Tax=Lymantria xylina multiple nucleopolyhedrovirus TaxID=2847840 RepID=D4N274_9ABAC|nr:ORF37 [Lymantria xylina nucleopolyhedrovirus]ADD73746.1 ORF37 [Lymantria xylina nucleopolyhedrovirus]
MGRRGRRRVRVPISGRGERRGFRDGARRRKVARAARQSHLGRGGRDDRRIRVLPHAPPPLGGGPAGGVRGARFRSGRSHLARRAHISAGPFRFGGDRALPRLRKRSRAVSRDGRLGRSGRSRARSRPPVGELVTIRADASARARWRIPRLAARRHLVLRRAAPPRGARADRGRVRDRPVHARRRVGRFRAYISYVSLSSKYRKIMSQNILLVIRADIKALSDKVDAVQQEVQDLATNMPDVGALTGKIDAQTSALTTVQSVLDKIEAVLNPEIPSLRKKAK